MASGDLPRIRVAMLLHQYPFAGGAERQQAEIAPFLQALNVDLHMVVRKRPGQLAYEVVSGVPVHRAPVPGPRALASVAYTVGALAKLRQLKPDVVHAHIMFSPARTAVYARQLFGASVVVTPHGGGQPGDVARLLRRRFGRGQIRLLRNHVNAFISISRLIDGELAGIGIPEARRFPVPNGVDAERFAPLNADEKCALRASLGLPDAPIVVFAGRLIALKRVNNLIAVWPAVRAVHPEALLLVLGTGEEEAALKASAGDGVRFEGLIENVVPYLQAADIFALPSTAEGFSVAILEALSCGLAAVVTDVGGARDVIQDRENGWIVQPDDLPGLQEAFITLLKDTSQRLTLGNRGRETILSDYQLPVIAQKLRAVYDHVLQAKK